MLRDHAEIIFFAILLLVLGILVASGTRSQMVTDVYRYEMYEVEIETTY